MTTIPASAIVNVIPSVLNAGGNALDLNGLLLTTNNRIPIGSVASFADAASVSDFFGDSARESDLATIYFNGFENSTAKPGAFIMTQYPLDDVYAYLRGASLAAMTIAQLQALSGVLGITIDDVLHNASINLGAATSFSNAASIIGSGLGIAGPQVATFTGEIAGGTMTVTVLSTGSLGVGSILSGSGITVGTFITEQLSGTTGGVGTYSVSPVQAAASQAVTAYDPAVSYDSVSSGFIIRSSTVGDASNITYGSGALATDLKLTLVTGAVISQGADAAVPGDFMDELVDNTRNWAMFTTAFDPDEGSGNAQKLLFAAWVSGAADRYAYVPWDTDESPLVTVPATSSLGYLIGQANYAGSAPIYAPDADLAVFMLGIGASIDFEALNGRSTFAFRRQDGLIASVTSRTAADNLIANGYNLYGAYGTANDEFVWLYPGKISGDFLWIDSYVNQIWLNNAFQLALMVLLQNALSIPYNAVGSSQVEAALSDPINAATNFGAIRSGIQLSASQKAAVNAAAGVTISGVLEARGWYLQILPASAAVRQARESPPCNFWYTDGQSVQQIELSSVALT